jgi:replicative DNA helicase
MAYELADSIQRGIIYLAKSDPTFLIQSMPMVKSEYFEYPSHQKFFQVVVDHYQKYKKLPTDDFILEEVKSLMSSTELLSDYKDELEQINNLDEKSLDNEDYLLDLVENFAKEQAITDAVLSSISLIEQKKYDDIEDLVRGALTVTRNLDLGVNYFSSFEDRFSKEENEQDYKFRTLFDSMNESLEGGLAAKELAMVVAPPGVGKSLYLANQAARSVIDGHNVLYVSLEMSEDRVAQRMDSIFTQVKQSDLKHRRSTIIERFDKIKKAKPNMGSLRIKEFPTKRATVSTLRSFLSQLRNAEDFEPDVIIVDYLELLSTDATLKEYQAQERLAQELRGLAIEHKCLLWTATQTNREGKRVSLITDTELADSYGKTRVCDLVFSVNQNELEFDKGEARIYVIKSRNGRSRYVIPSIIDYSKLTIHQKTT